MHHVTLELLHEKCLKEEYKRNVIEFNNYFRYSGKEEKTNPKIAYLMEKEKRYLAKIYSWGKQDMSKYKLIKRYVCKTNSRQANTKKKT